MPKTRVVELYLDLTYEDKKVPYDVNKLNPKKDPVQFEPVCVFKRRTKRSFWSWLPFERKKNSLILYVHGAFKALRFDKITDKLQPLWTKEESERFADSQIKKSLEEHKPMTWTQFFIILGVNVVTLIVMLGIAQRLRLF